MNWKIIKYILRKITFFLWFLPRKCPICGMRLFRFFPFKISSSYGGYKLTDWLCPGCSSHPRHRNLWLFLHRKTEIFQWDKAFFLHIAPDRCFVEIFAKIFKNYLTADLYKTNVMVKMDITNIGYQNESFDIIFCLHVLEHIPDDNKAISELYRVLKKEGIAVIMVPQTKELETYEDWSITSPDGRLKAFGQHDHVRRYGQDFLLKLQKAGFIVSVIKQDNYLSGKEIKKYIGTKYNGDIFICKK